MTYNSHSPKWWQSWKFWRAVQSLLMGPVVLTTYMATFYKIVLNRLYFRRRQFYIVSYYNHL